MYLIWNLLWQIFFYFAFPYLILAFLILCSLQDVDF